MQELRMGEGGSCNAGRVDAGLDPAHDPLRRTEHSLGYRRSAVCIEDR